MGDVAYLNKNLVSWSDLRFFIALPDSGGAGQRFFGWHSLDFGSEKRERPPQYGQSRAHAPIGLPAGKYTPPNPKMGWLAHAADADEKAAFDSLITMLMKAAPDGRSYGDVRMNWTLQVLNKGVTIDYAWEDVYIVGGNASWEETAEGLKMEKEFTCTRFYTNNGTLFDSSEE